MRITKEYLENIGFTINKEQFGNLNCMRAYKAVGELEIYVTLLKSNTNLKIIHRQSIISPIVHLINCESIDKFNLALMLVDINPVNCNKL